MRGLVARRYGCPEVGDFVGEEGGELLCYGCS